ncbi:hypothetical protein [Patiriisocius marinistellae]|nr:hypothetical protein [Patiriisocius marinistellae]
MKGNSRGSIAFIVDKLVNKGNSTTIYDNAESTYLSYNGIVEPESIDLYDYANGCYISGRKSDDMFTLFHFGEGNHIDLKIDGNKFTGFDYSSDSYFKGIIKESSISVFDYGEGTDFNYATS